MIWTLVTFLIALYFLNKLVFGRIQAALEERRDLIAESVDAAERTRSEAQGLLDDYKQQLATARAEADGIIDRARKTGDEMTSRVREESDKLRMEQLETTKKQVNAEVNKAMDQLRTELADLTVQATAKVLDRTLDADTHQQLVEQAVAELDFQQLEKIGAGT